MRLCTYIALIILLGSCTDSPNPTSSENDDDVPIPVNVEYLTVVKGSIFDVFMYDTLAVKPEALTILGEEIPVTEDGTFELSLPVGTYPVEVTGQYYEHFLDTLRVSGDTLVANLELKSIMDDYFPIQVGQRLVYHYHSSSGGSGGSPDKVDTKGSLTMEVLRDSISTENGGSIFLLLNTFDAKIFSDPFNAPKDTIDVYNEYDVSISLNPDSTIFSSMVNPIPVYIGGWTRIGVETGTYASISNRNKDFFIPRFYPRSRAKERDIFITLGEFGNSGYVLRKDVGLYRYFSRSMGHSRFSTEVRLAD